jgi:hypothetical protein
MLESKTPVKGLCRHLCSDMNLGFDGLFLLSGFPCSPIKTRKEPENRHALKNLSSGQSWGDPNLLGSASHAKSAK